MLHFSMRQGEQAQISFSCMNFDDNDSEDAVTGEDEDVESDEDTSEDDESDEDMGEDDDRMNSVVIGQRVDLQAHEKQRLRQNLPPSDRYVGVPYVHRLANTNVTGRHSMVYF